MNLFATVLTYPAPSANYRGESELNRAVIQKVTDGKFDYPIFSPESIRNALRETLRKYGLPCNRTRLDDEEQLAVRFEDYPHAEAYADDFFFGYLVAASGKDRKEIEKILEKRGKDYKFQFKRDSVLRMNMAKALEPYRHNAVFTQSPLDATPKDVKKHANATTSALLHRETAVSAFQYPFALNIDDCKPKSEWTRKLLKGIGELNDVAGNHARSYFEFAPASIVVRLTKQLVAGYQTYGFHTVAQPNGEAFHLFPEVVNGILHEPTADYPGTEFYIGGKIVKDMSDDQLNALTSRGVTVNRNPQELLQTVATAALGKG